MVITKMEKNKEEKCTNMEQVLKYIEKKVRNRRIIRYMKGKHVVEVYGEHFFEDIREKTKILATYKARGKHVGIIGENSYEWLVSLCGVLRSGAVAVLLDKETDAEALEELSERTDLDILIYDKAAEGKVRDLKKHKTVQCIPMWEHMNVQTVDCKLLEKSHINTDRKPEALACIYFTAGTTDKSKAVMMSDHGLTASVCQRVNDKNFQALLSVMPFHHLSGFVTVLNALYLGAEVCMGGEIKYFYRYLEYMKPDYVLLVPSMMQILAKKLKNSSPNGNSLGWNLKMINCSGAVFQSRFLQLFQERHILVVQGYGASEAGGIGIMYEMTEKNKDSIGKPTSELEIRIVDGELFLRSESIMMGYYKDELATREVLQDGWYATGDLCEVDEDGFLHLTGRKRNVIILDNGENISPEEIEGKLYASKYIKEVMIGVENQLLTATILPDFSKEFGKEAEESVKQKIREDVECYNKNAPIYKQIRKLYFTEQSLKKNSVGKVLRHNVKGDGIDDRERCN